MKQEYPFLAILKPYSGTIHYYWMNCFIFIEPPYRYNQRQLESRIGCYPHPEGEFKSPFKIRVSFSNLWQKIYRRLHGNE